MNVEPAVDVFRVSTSLLTDIGCRRAVNEDAGRVVRPNDPEVLVAKGLLVLVADGMGGHSAGDVASRLAIEIVHRRYYDNPAPPEVSLPEAFREANRRIHATAMRDPGLCGMGTTCTALVLVRRAAFCSHVGDSRLYLVRAGRLHVMTEDHSAVEQMVDRGLISREQARTHSEKNIILRALGTHADVEVTTWDEPLPLNPGDRFLLCSDGLYGLVEDDEIHAALTKERPRHACERLISMAKARGGQDNITVGVASVDDTVTEPLSLRETREIKVLS